MKHAPLESEGQVGRNSLILFQQDQVSPVVVVGFFAHRHEEHEREQCDVRRNKSCDIDHEQVMRREVRAGVQTDLQPRNELREGHRQKIQVEEKPELLVEHDRQESEGVVFLIFDGIRCEPLSEKGKQMSFGKVGPTALLPEHTWWSERHSSRLVF